MASGLLRRAAGAGPLARLLRLQGHAPVESATRHGLHPLVVPIARSTSGDTYGLLRWPLTEPEAPVNVVVQSAANGSAGLSLRPRGTIAQYARRAAVEVDAAGASNASGLEIMEAAADATMEAGARPYEAGELEASRLKAVQFLLMRVGPFVDMWDTIAHSQLEKGDETAALVAGERASALNPGWGCCLYLQSQLMTTLKRPDEARDLALGALELPWWTLGAPLRDVLAAAQLSHIEDLRALVRSMEDKVREQQNAPPRTASELAMMRAMDALDEVVRTEAEWDGVRQTVAEALGEAGYEDDAAIARGD